jgi:signal transduction histidine kinase
VEAKSRVLGVIRIYSDKPHYFSEREQQLLKNLSNLGAVAIQNARSYSELEALNEEKLWFARMTHHQLRAPLAAIRATLDALPYADTMSPKQQELADRARRRVDDAFETIRDLLDLAAAQRPLDEHPGEPIILASALEKAVELARERANSKGVELEVSIPENDILVALRPEDVDRIFSNLLDNSLKYTAEGGRVKLDVRSGDERVQIEVSDTGIGIEPKDQERIFEGFYRTAAAKSTGEMGTGLGLSIVKKLVERWGGELQLESTPGKGTRFTITLPIATAMAEETDSLPESD